MRRRAFAALLALVLDVACNGGLEPIPVCAKGFVGICGTVTFQGTEPDSTQAVYIVAYHTFPHSRDSLFNFQPPLPSLHALPLGGVPTLYNIPVEPGRYEWVLAVWVKQGFNLTNADSTLRETGYYRDPADTSQPGAVTVAGGPADPINFVVDFAHMHPTYHHLNPPCP